MNKFITVNIIPTGIGANIGGFAGDANPVNTLLEEISDVVITHPNAVNAASLYPATKKTLYVEGFALEKFIEGSWGLKTVNSNKIGIIIDKKTENNLTAIINAINATRTVFGANIIGYTITEEEIGAKVIKNQDKNASIPYDGIIKNQQTIFNAAEKLIKNGAEAIAIFAYLENPYEDDDEDYLSGVGADPIGRLEAKISHLIVEKYKIPSAHAPIIDDYERKISDPRVSAEEIGFTYIPCVIKGLQFAPKIVDIQKDNFFSYTNKDISCVLAPYSALKHKWVEDCIKNKIPIIAIKENTTVLNNTPEILNITEEIISADNYLESIGIITSIKAGIDYRSVRRPINQINII
ncbi:MAG: DUF3326 domain-containing protein [Candidatus Sericytochromatia bacterium]